MSLVALTLRGRLRGKIDLLGFEKDLKEIQ